MITDPRFRKLAVLMTEYSAPVEAGQQAVIRATSLAEPLVVELSRAILERGAWPVVMMRPALLTELYHRYASDDVLSELAPIEQYAFDTMDVIYSIYGQANTRAQSNVDPDRMVLRERALQGLSETVIRRSAEGDLQWSLTMYPAPAYAQDAEMGLIEFTEFLFAANFLNADDPVALWQEQAERQQQLIDHLEQAQEVHIRAPGTDLRVGIAGRTWINDCGEKNLPGGEVFTGPVEDQVDGHVTFTFPAIRRGREVRGARLRFEAGKVVDASAEVGEAFLLKMLDTDEGARYLGEFALGTNYNIKNFMRNTLFDEKIGGTVHMALGRSYPETGGKNESTIHWDLVCDLRSDGEVYVDGELFQKDGRFTLFDDGGLAAGA